MAVSLRKTRNIEAHVLFTGVYLLKRLFVGFLVSCRASPFGAAPVFSFFASSAPPPWRSAFSRFALVVNLGFPVLASGSNCAVKPTRLRRAAYFRSLVPSPVSCAQPLISALGPVPKASKPFGPPALVQQAPPAILLAALRRFRGPAVFLGLRPSSSLGAPFRSSGLTLRSSASHVKR